MDETLKILLGAPIVIGQAMLVTIVVTVLSIILGFIVGVPLAIGRTYGNRFVKIIIQAYEGFFRGTPLLVVLFILYFGLKYVTIGGGTIFGIVRIPEIRINLERYPAAILSLGLVCSAYLSLIFRGAIQSIGIDQYNAARALGMGKWTAIFNIVLLQAFRISIAGFTNEFTIVLKDSPITYFVAIPEMLTQGLGIIDSAMGRVFYEILIPISLIYFILFLLSNKLFRLIEKKLQIPGFETGGR